MTSSSSNSTLFPDNDIQNKSVEYSIIIPAYNEEKRLPPTLEEIVDFFRTHLNQVEILVVDDGSTDGTAALVSKYSEQYPCIRLIQAERNLGKGAAVTLGVEKSIGEYILFTDADGSTPIKELERLKMNLDNNADIAIGSRALKTQGTCVSTSLHRKALGRLFNWCMNIILLPGISDTQCGFKLFTSQSAKYIFSKLHTTGFSFDLEVLYIARKIGLQISEVPVNWHNVEGSKVDLVADAIRMFRDGLLIRFWHKNTKPLINK